MPTTLLLIGAFVVLAMIVTSPAKREGAVAFIQADGRSIAKAGTLLAVAIIAAGLFDKFH